MTVRNAIPHSTRVSTKPKRRTAKGAKPESPGIALFELGYILDNANHGMRIINKDFTIRFINQAFTELSGVNQKEAIGRKCWAILKGPFCHTPNCFLNRILNGEERVQVEIDRQRKDGTTIPCIVTAIPFNTINGEFTSIIETLQDITERKHLEEQISESEDRYRALIDLGTNIGEAIIMLQDIDGKEGVQTYISDQWSLITGYTKRELLGMSFFDLVSPKDREPSIKRHKQKISGKSMPTLFELSIIQKDGTEVPVELTSAVTTYRGKIANVAYIRDVTERKQNEEQLKTYQQQLKGMVKKRTIQLRQEIEQRKKAEKRLKELYNAEATLRRELETQIRQRTDFTRALVHDLKTPLSAVIASSEALLDGIDEAKIRLARNIYKGGCALDKRIDELLDMARGEVGMLSLDCSTIEPLELVKEIAEQVSQEVKRKGQCLLLDLPSSLPNLWADYERLQQVIFNLLSNALKFNRKEGKITLRVRARDSQIVFEVQDEGKGIDPNDQQVLFQPYRRLEREQSKFSGLGLGLALSKMLVELHRGQIFVKSKRGYGSTFGFYIPLKFDNSAGNDS